MQGTIECYVVRDFDNFPLAAMRLLGICGIRTAGGMTLMRTATAGKQLSGQVGRLRQRPAGGRPARSGSCLLPPNLRPHRPGLVFRGDGGNGPLLEGGRHGRPRRSARDRSFSAKTRRNRSPRPFRLRRSPAIRGRITPRAGRCAISWSTTPTTRRSSSSMGRGFLAGKDISFDQTYAPTTRRAVVRVSFLPPAYRPGLPRGPVCLGLEQEVRRSAARTIADGHDRGGPRMAAHRPDGHAGDAVRISRHGQLADRRRSPRPSMPMATTMAAADWWAC